MTYISEHYKGDAHGGHDGKSGNLSHLL